MNRVEHPAIRIRKKLPGDQIMSRYTDLVHAFRDGFGLCDALPGDPGQVDILFTHIGMHGFQLGSGQDPGFKWLEEGWEKRAGNAT